MLNTHREDTDFSLVFMYVTKKTNLPVVQYMTIAQWLLLFLHETQRREADKASFWPPIFLEKNHIFWISVEFWTKWRIWFTKKTTFIFFEIFLPLWPPGNLKKNCFSNFFKKYIIRFRISCWSQISDGKPKKIEHWPKKDWIYVQVAYSHLIGLTSFGRPMCCLETQTSTWVYSKTSKLSEY